VGFTLNIVDREDRAIVRKFTKPVEDEGGMLNGFPVTKAAPVRRSSTRRWLS